MQQRNNIYLICKEAINNAIKYSECHHLNFALRNYDHRFQIDIRDDGKGFDADQVDTNGITTGDEHLGGNGIKNMNARAIDMKANLYIHSTINEGTTVQLSLQL